MAVGLRNFFRRGATPPPNTPLPPAQIPQALQHLPGLEWVWNPGLQLHRGAQDGIANGVTVLPGVKLFHDGADQALQLRPAEGRGLTVQLRGFQGSFLSLVLDLPPAAVQGLKLRHLMRLDASVTASGALQVYARLNIRHGPNVEQVVRPLPPGPGSQMVEFDMFYVGLNEKRVELAWIDLIFNPEGDQEITLTGLSVSRRPRAAL